MRSLRPVLVFCVLVASLFGPMSAHAETILTIKSGKQELTLDRAQLEQLPLSRVTTGTEWTNGSSIFEGPLARDVLAMLQPDDNSSGIVTATAANDYSVKIPASDFLDYDVILAMTMDGERLTLRDKGPLWIVYPRDDHPELSNPLINSRWIWQLVALELK
jgi:hypothetical protein